VQPEPARRFFLVFSESVSADDTLGDLDLRYVDTWSPLLDAAILARTTRAVLHSNGAY